MNNSVRTLLATTALFFSTQMLPMVVSANAGCAFEKDQQGFIATCSEEKQEVILTGVIQSQTIASELPGYAEGFANYQVDASAIDVLKAIKEPTKIVVIIGTWCPDCHRETPHFMRIIETVANPNIEVEYIGVDRNKQDPEGLAAKYAFSRIPTFIVHQQGKEMGRIVERPTVSLEADLVKILQ
ncbi:MAG: thioredoxin family protein [Shewanella psychromarinicola]|jgi:thiol-disulfide isomerase/thioredoxin|uniref:Thioredoxin n=1 Tax=Shewanella psychromarinicola TaxID=2487742 RepID=A0A3N4DMZ4_9GAMM|nr:MULTISPECIES: thioredoxin family protein [Shewanella]AZG33825.1 thioredoxin [Shewanella psychromarinicola]MCL1083491.1 thioredoxin family protein [Shewanella psychromarinicola]PKG78851.1 thiol reductase thioredoxin [Shewanella sp. Actino-trap-3]RPA22940.1 thioredoxin [Shewanella psychromarinicola]|tara:strand:+ start:12154 stop:12705 length:552 start_codon:yes stop_codon:yes gene_type:complete